jgi:hypothetical protein
MGIFGDALCLIACYFWIAAVASVAYGIVMGVAFVLSPFVNLANKREEAAKKRNAYNQLSPEEKEMLKISEAFGLERSHKKYLQNRISDIVSGSNRGYDLVAVSNIHDFCDDDFW